MIARVQNTTRKIQIGGETATIWEGMSQKGIRFHLFAFDAPIMAGQDVRKAEFDVEMSDVKTPASETAALPEKL